MIVTRHFSHGHFMMFAATSVTFLVYNAFFRGIYNFRSREIINMKSVPFFVRFGLSALVSAYICHDTHIKSIYDPDLYKIALKYRSYYDAEF